MDEIKNFIDSTVRTITNNPEKMRFAHDLKLAKMYPKGEETFFNEMKFEIYKRLNESNTIGHNWIDNDLPDPLKNREENEMSRIEALTYTWIQADVIKYLTKNGFLLELKYGKPEEVIQDFWESKRKYRDGIRIFLQQYFYIEMINNHLLTLNSPKLSVDFSDFFNPEFTNKELFIKRLKERMHGKKSQALRFMVEILKAREILNVNYGERKQLFEAMNDYFDWDIGTYVSIFDIPALRELKTSNDFQLYISRQNCQHKRPYQKIEEIIDSILNEQKI